MPRTGRRAAAARTAAGAVAVAVALTGTARLHRGGGVDAGSVPAAPAVAGAPVPPAAAATGSTPPAAAAAPAAAPPVRLRMTAISLDAPVTPVGVSADGVLGVPDDVHLLGWWGAPAGADRGTTVVDGHVDSAAAGAGALFRLAESPLGAAVTVGTARGEVRYTVQARRSYAKSALPADLFALDGPPRLVLVTCGGAFDRRTRHYDSNTVVYAVPG